MIYVVGEVLVGFVFLNFLAGVQEAYLHMFCCSGSLPSCQTRRQ